MAYITREKVKQLIKDGEAEVEFGDIETVRPGGVITLRMSRTKKSITFQIENCSEAFMNGVEKANNLLLTKNALPSSAVISSIRSSLYDASNKASSAGSDSRLDQKQQKACKDAEKLIDQARRILFEVE